eukprot:GHVH01011426.1.p1 GENE.GHVH01011426.1~~GHVH01011426.1.p1  ORF type:complete len:263 (-),score=41.81 GHVH01011426.1:259-1047(-)
MQGSRNEYDRGVNTFSPEGRLFQVEYALGAVKLGSTTIGVRCKDGVILCTEKRVQNPLLDPTKGDMIKILEVDSHVAACSAGVIADARLLIDHARVEAANHHFTYDEKMSIQSICNSIADIMLDFSGVNDKKKKRMSRPFGCAILLGGIDPVEGPQLWCVDPSGSAVLYKATAIGSAWEGSESLLQEKYSDDISFEDAEILALQVLRQGMEEKLSNVNVEMTCVKVGCSRLTHYSTEEVQQVISRLPAPGAAQRLLEDAANH